MTQPDRIDTESLRVALAAVLWIGGAPDAGKTTVARLIAERHGLRLYHYDRRDLPHHEILARRTEAYRTFLRETLEERWVRPEPEQLVQRALNSFYHRWPLVIDDLLALLGGPGKAPVLAEGFGLLPELVAPVISSVHQAVWLVPAADFKLASMQRRSKPSFAREVSNPERVRDSLFKRDMLLAEYVREQAQARDLTVYEVDDTRSPQELATIIEAHFASNGPPRNCVV